MRRISLQRPIPNTLANAKRIGVQDDLSKGEIHCDISLADLHMKSIEVMHIKSGPRRVTDEVRSLGFSYSVSS